jgi:hypothetical protein
VLLVAYIAVTRLYRKARLYALFLGDTLFSCQRSGHFVLCENWFSFCTIHGLLSHDVSTRRLFSRNLGLCLQKTRTDLWHDFSFTAKQLLSPRTSSKYHASRGFSPDVRAPIIARMMVGNAPPFVSPAGGTSISFAGQWEFAQLALKSSGLGSIRH